MKEMGVQEFVRRLRKTGCDTDCRYSFFLGAGCSKSSGIPTASELVMQWLPRLKYIKTGNDSDPEEWAAKAFKGFTKEKAGTFYSEIFKALFDNHEDGQKEIERLVEEKEPGFGYGVLAQLLSHPDYGKHFNVVLTTNFDDLVADALYLYSCKKPLVIYHDSLISFVKISSTRPIVIKLHGDAKFDTRNRTEETASLEKAVEDVLKTFFCEAGLIFVGYGGNDKSIAKVFKYLPRNAFPRGIYWVGNKRPEKPINSYLEKHNATLIKHSDFDELLLLLREEFKLAHPEKDRYERVYSKYFDTFRKLAEKIAKEDSPVKQELSKAIDTATSEFRDWQAVELEASKYKASDPQKANQIYQNGIAKFPNSSELHDNYINFLIDCKEDPSVVEIILKKAEELALNDPYIIGRYAKWNLTYFRNYDRAEELYKKALELDQNNTASLSNYANFLVNIRRDYDMADKLYKKAIEIDPNSAVNYSNYGLFILIANRNYDKAESFLLKAFSMDPNNANIVGNYASFSAQIRENYDQAKMLYKKSFAVEPDNANNLCNYGALLVLTGKETEGLKLINKAIITSKYDFVTLRIHFYIFVFTKKTGTRRKALKEIKRLINLNVRLLGRDFSWILKFIHKVSHPHPEFIQTLVKVISDGVDAQELEKFEIWTKETE